jgi:4-amino-4-deoxy-L-arabinose transferase-like glycosyltransferase
LTLIHAKAPMVGGKLRRDLTIGLILVLISLVFRLCYVARIHWVTIYGDMVHYDHAAQVIINRHVFSFWGYQPDAFVTPGYPLFLALCYRVALLVSSSHQVGMKAAILAQAVLSAATAMFFYWTSRRMLNRVFAVMVTLLWIFYLPAVVSIGYLLTETLYVFFLLMFVWLFVLSMERRTWYHWLLTGVVLAFCGLVRPTVFPLAIAAAIYLLWQWRKGEATLVQAAIEYAAYAGGFIITMLPWWIRNYAVFHKVVLSDTEVGNPLLFGSDPYFRSGPLLGHGLNQVQQKELAIHRIVEGFTHHFGEYLQWYTIGKLGILFGRPWYPPFGAHPNPVLWLWVHMHVLFVILGVIGILIGLSYPKARFVSLVALFLIVIQLPFIPVNRYGFPVMPFFFLGTGILLYWFYTGGFIRSWKRKVEA